MIFPKDYFNYVSSNWKVANWKEKKFKKNQTKTTQTKKPPKNTQEMEKAASQSIKALT